MSKVDKSLQEIEEDPPVYAKALYEITTGPVGTSAGRGMVAMIKMTGKVGTEAIKAAAPVGKWVLTQSFKVVANAAMQGMTSASRKEKQNTKQKDDK